MYLPSNALFCPAVTAAVAQPTSGAAGTGATLPNATPTAATTTTATCDNTTEWIGYLGAVMYTFWIIGMTVFQVVMEPELYRWRDWALFMTLNPELAEEL